MLPSRSPPPLARRRKQKKSCLFWGAYEPKYSPHTTRHRLGPGKVARVGALRLHAPRVRGLALAPALTLTLTLTLAVT